MTKFITAFPGPVQFVHRQWRALMETLEGDSRHVSPHSIEPIASWDIERVYTTLERWNSDAYGLVLAPFGPKPHTVGMVLFAIKHSLGIYYTQPKAYHPRYSEGAGESIGYVLKWDGGSCLDS